MPFRPETRQYRNFAASNFHAVSRDADDSGSQTYDVDGYFTTFNEPYQLYPDYWEEIGEHALDECDMSDVLFQVNHDGHVYARNRNGSMTVTADGHGGHCVADLSGTKRGREELYESISNGLVDRMSFGFTIAEDGFEYMVDSEGVYHTRITKIAKLYDVSAIEGFPANEGTEISARSLRDGVIEAIRKKAELDAAQPATLPDDAVIEERMADATEDTPESVIDNSAVRRRKARALELEAISLGY